MPLRDASSEWTIITNYNYVITKKWLFIMLSPGFEYHTTVSLKWVSTTVPLILKDCHLYDAMENL